MASVGRAMLDLTTTVMLLLTQFWLIGRLAISAVDNANKNRDPLAPAPASVFQRSKIIIPPYQQIWEIPKGEPPEIITKQEGAKMSNQ